jgi:hypothetical protein
MPCYFFRKFGDFHQPNKDIMLNFGIGATKRTTKTKSATKSRTKKTKADAELDAIVALEERLVNLAPFQRSRARRGTWKSFNTPNQSNCTTSGKRLKRSKPKASKSKPTAAETAAGRALAKCRWGK